ncbi:CatB-related O-acetyltransferase [Microlunatus soli]|uniref:Transferase hexapeptide (Six repeat-containing protein) n=1 Tax=Microlunatus soli TaxID=630515 RepID=A0A1H1YS57_9ACTN|nr:CatB-related O-acetyltransferase [Microlunatus soli]SDT24213.1 transferase hexapeptide (six repeat-containing protein) [Microlunatus soli]
MAGSTLTISDNLLDQLYHHSVLLKLNSGPPAEGHYGWLTAGQQLRLHHTVRLEQNSALYAPDYRPMLGGRGSSGLCTIGAFSYSYSALPDGLQVGRYCSISRGLSFIDSFHPTDRLTTSALLFRPKNQLYAPALTPAVKEYSQTFSVIGDAPYPTIGNDVWIGADVTLAKGIRIGHGAIIAANATVTRDVPAYAIVAGNPARMVRMRFGDELVGRLLAAQWWNYDPAGVFETTDPELSLSWIEKGAVDPYPFSSITLEPGP